MVFYDEMLERLREQQIPGYKERKERDEQPRIRIPLPKPDVHYHPPKHYDAPKPDRGVEIVDIVSKPSLDKLVA